MPNLLGMWNPLYQSFFSKLEFRIARNHDLLEANRRTRRSQIIQVALYSFGNCICSGKRFRINHDEQVTDRAPVVRIQCTKNLSADLGARQQPAKHCDRDAEAIALRTSRRT